MSIVHSRKNGYKDYSDITPLPPQSDVPPGLSFVSVLFPVPSYSVYDRKHCIVLKLPESTEKRDVDRLFA